MTDSTTVQRWISDGLSGKARLKTKAASEMLIRRRVDMVLSLVSEYNLQLVVTLVNSASNKADALTRVPRRWLHPATVIPSSTCAAVVQPDAGQLVTEIHHKMGHPGVRRTLYFVKRINPMVSKRQVRQTIANCDACQSIDPAPVKWKQGSLGVKEIWQRVAMDITHYRGMSYLSLVDCGPSRFAVWRPLRLQSSEAVIRELEAVFFERGPPEELLTDNDTAFRSKMFLHFAERWDVHIRFRGRPNLTTHPHGIGDPVWVKPHGIRCDSQYTRGTVTKILSSHAVKIDGVPRHVRDIRRRVLTEEQANSKSSESSSDDGMSTPVLPTWRVKKALTECDSGPGGGGQEVRRDDREQKAHCESATELEQNDQAIEGKTDSQDNRTNSDGVEAPSWTPEKIPRETSSLPSAMSNV
uniref:Integrase catalytic domain-containing protein n=1 Tax=Trichuris muris TaxID=70415 RepID=A0A5S6R3V7_TRIMR